MSTPLTRIVRGSAFLATRPLKAADGTDLPTTAIQAATLELYQFGRLKTTLPLGDATALRFGTDAKSLVLELTAATTAALELGVLRERYRLRLLDAAYLASAGAPEVILEKEELEIA